MGFNDNQNRTITNNIVDTLKLNPISDNIPKTVIPSIQPTFEVNRKIATVRSATRSTTGTSTVLTTSSTVDTYLIGVGLSYVKDATCDIATGRLTVAGAIEGTSQALMSLNILTTTAQSDSEYVSFSTPVKLDRNAAVTMATTFTAGAMSASATLYFYTEEAGNNFV